MFNFLKQGKWRRIGKQLYWYLKCGLCAIVVFFAVIGFITVMKFVSGG